MRLELSELFHAAAGDEAAAAEREFPLTQATVEGYVRAARRRRVAGGAFVAVAGAVIIGVSVFGLSYFWKGEPLAASPTPSITSSASEEPSTTPSPSPSPSSTGSESPTPAAPVPNETTPPAPVELPAVVAPGQVTVVSAGAGGGSGETVVGWTAVDGATGYRVYRSSSADVPFVPTVSYVVATSVTTIEFGGGYEKFQVWRPSATTFEYVEAVDNLRAYFRIAAFNAGGSGPQSAVVCGSPITAPEGC